LAHRRDDSWTEVIEAELPPLFDCLKLAAREVGGMQIQNSGTVAGNLCNASPAATACRPCLRSTRASRSRAQTAAERCRSPLRPRPAQDGAARRRARHCDPRPKPKHAARSDFLKLGARKYLVISIAMVCDVLEHRTASCERARIAVGSVLPVARAPAAARERAARPAPRSDLERHSIRRAPGGSCSRSTT
jgi:CO/xanthine dehydrogenase FAD-binding subunit